MISVDFTQRTCFVYALLLAALLFPAFASSQTQPTTIVLHDERISVTPKEFYIAGITDERENRDAVAQLIASNTFHPNETYMADLEGGGLAAIKNFVSRNLPRNTALRPVTIALKKFIVTEKALPGGMAEGHAIVVFSFSLENGETPQHLIDYDGSATYTRSAGPAQDVEPTLRHLLENGIVYLNTWMNRQAGDDIRLARSVKISFSDYHEKKEGDSIYYDAKRPLTWADFQSKVLSNKYAAEVFPSIGYAERTDVADGVINVNIDVKACLPKSAAWVKEGDMSDYILNHEQRHFDIAAIAARHFKTYITSKNLTPETYEAIINAAYLDAYREMSNMQRQYDEETSHGSNRAEQDRWDKKIDDELRAWGIK